LGSSPSVAKGEKRKMGLRNLKTPEEEEKKRDLTTQARSDAWGGEKKRGEKAPRKGNRGGSAYCRKSSFRNGRGRTT